MAQPCASPVEDIILTIHGALCSVGRVNTPKPFPPPVEVKTFELTDSDDYFLIDEDGAFLDDSIV